MDSNHVDALAKRLAGSASRRNSLLTIGGAGLAAVSGFAMTGSARKKHKKGKNKNKDKDKKCRRQEGECNAFFAPLCADEDAPEDCVALMATCCEQLGQCQATAYLDCLFDVIRPAAPE
jgi:hypothetical protein